MIDVSTPADLSYIVALSKKHAEELGFLSRAAMEHYLLTNRVRMARENGDACGYFLTSSLGTRCRVYQAAVQLDARGLAHGQSLLADLIARGAAVGTRSITLHCRDGLASNGFWSACGFSCSSLQLGGSARRKIINCWSLDVAAAISNPSLPYAAAILRRLAAGAEAGTQ